MPPSKKGWGYSSTQRLCSTPSITLKGKKWNDFKISSSFTPDDKRTQTCLYSKRDSTVLLMEHYLPDKKVR